MKAKLISYYPLERNSNSWSRYTRDDGSTYDIFDRVRSSADVAQDVIGNYGDDINKLTADDRKFWKEFFVAMDNYATAKMDAEDRITAADDWNDGKNGICNKAYDEIIVDEAYVEDAIDYNSLAARLNAIYVDKE